METRLTFTPPKNFAAGGEQKGSMLQARRALAELTVAVYENQWEEVEDLTEELKVLSRHLRERVFTEKEG